MADRIVIENRRGCGCGSFLALLLLVGLAINYWYVALPGAVLLVGGGMWWAMRHPEDS